MTCGYVMLCPWLAEARPIATKALPGCRGDAAMVVGELASIKSARDGMGIARPA